MRTGLSAFSLLLSAASLFGYDLHVRSLTPIVEQPVPAGEAIRLYENGEPQFAIVALRENGGRSRLGKCGYSIVPALTTLSNAFAKCFGKGPAVFKPAQTNEIAKYRYRILVGDQPEAVALGLDFRKLPDQGFAVRTFERGVAIVGNDTSLDPDYNRDPLDRKGDGLGTFYGVLDFCERFLGVRFYFPGADGTIFPPQKDLTVRPVSYVDRPVFQRRGTPYSIYLGVKDDKILSEMEKCCATMRRWDGKGDTSIGGLWRVGGTTPPRHEHYPEPLSFTKGMSSNDLRRVFYTTTSGKLMYNPKGHFGNYYDIIHLDGFAQVYADAVKEFIDSKGKVNPHGFQNGYINNTSVTYSQCDSFLRREMFIDDPVVKELGLVSADDLEFAKEEERGLTRNVCGRFHQHLAKLLATAAPGRTVCFSAYYNTLWAPTDPRWTLPGNVDVEVCDGCLLTLPWCEKYRARSRALFGGWSKAMGGKPVGTAYLYNPGDPVMRAFVGENICEAVKVLGPLLGNAHINVDCCSDYRIFYAYYTMNKAQWNPALDPTAAIDEAFELCCGPKAGAVLKRFHRELFRIYRETCCRTGSFRLELSGRDVMRFERALAKAKELVAPGSAEARRLALITSYWTDVFSRAGRKAGSRPAEYLVPRVKSSEVSVDGKADEAFWADVKPQAFFECRTGRPAYAPCALRLVRDDTGFVGFFETDDPPQKGDVVEFYFVQPKWEEWHRIAVGADGRVLSDRKRELPIPQPVDTQWDVTKEGFTCRVFRTATRWGVEFHAPFRMFFEPREPWSNAVWKFNCVKTRAAEPRTHDGTSMTAGKDTDISAFSTIRIR